MLLPIFVWAIGAVSLPSAPPKTVDQDGLAILDKDGKRTMSCPLKGTEVNAKIEGFGARVVVVQTFTNPSKKPIEAVYTFPLPDDSAVDGMRMIIGNRIIAGVIKKKAEALATYEQAKKEGKSTALLDQERPNVFTQRVANIPAGAKIRVAITYVQLLKFENDAFEFNFPMVVGPRFTDATTPDPGKVTPPVTPIGTRSGSTIKLDVDLDAGAPITSLDSVLHKIDVKKMGPGLAHVQLAKADEIPNRDFILRYSIANDSVTSSLLTHTDPQRGGFFTLILMPPKTAKPSQIAPKESIFVIDQSGSQSGFPIQKSKELSIKLIRALNPDDTFNVVNFSNAAVTLWPQPRPNNARNRDLAIKYIEGLEANGGTELWRAVVASLTPPTDPKRPRIVVFNTDGFIGGEAEAIAQIQRHRGTSRMFTFGIGNSVNRYLINAMSTEGRGDSEFVTLNADADGAVKRFAQRTDAPVLTDISVAFEGVRVHDTLPRYIPDVFSEKPVILKGRYDRPGEGTILVTGKLGGKPWSQRYPITFPATGNSGSAIDSLWAREKVNDLDLQQRIETVWKVGKDTPDRDPKYWENAITELALKFNLMTAFTSFVAVDNRVVNPGGQQETVQVPVDMADGVSYSRIFGAQLSGQVDPRLAPAPTAPVYGAGDPLLTVDAPSTSTVVATFPEGDLKPLAWNDKTQKWEVRFDIPTTFVDGIYSVRVQIRNADSSRRTLNVPFEVSMQAPPLRPTSLKLADGKLRIELDGDARWARVALLTPWGDRLPLTYDAANGKIRLEILPPVGFQSGWFRLVAVDRAHNPAGVRFLISATGEIEKIEATEK